MRKFRLFNEKTIGLDSSKNPEKHEKNPPNLIVYQVNAKVPFELDVVFESASNSDREGTKTKIICKVCENSFICFLFLPDELSGDVLSRELSQRSSTFNQRFENTFALKQKGERTIN